MDEKRIQAAFKNIDSIISQVNLQRKEHAQLVSDLGSIQKVCQIYFTAKAEAKKELEDQDNKNPEDIDDE
jgi:hypothetical protein